MAKRFKQSAVEAVPHLKERLEESSAQGGEKAESALGTGKRFKPSAVEAIQPKIKTAGSFAAADAVQQDADAA